MTVTTSEYCDGFTDVYTTACARFIICAVEVLPGGRSRGVARCRSVGQHSRAARW
jgi:hypothetical protein